MRFTNTHIFAQKLLRIFLESDVHIVLNSMEKNCTKPFKNKDHRISV